MNPCEDYPCCGHGVDSNGQPDCPDSEGRFRCVECGKRLAKDAPSSICTKCERRFLQRMRDGEDTYDDSMNY